MFRLRIFAAARGSRERAEPVAQILMKLRRMNHQVLDHLPVIIVGAGQAGLAMSYCLQQREIRHILFERERIGHAWRAQRWDSFCLVTPNWQCRLPGHPYAGADPHGFMVKDEIVKYVEAYAASFSPPVREGVSVQRVSQRGTGFLIETSLGSFSADHVVMASGPYHTPKIPPLAAALDPDILQLDATRYRNPAALPDGPVMVVGTGQSGCQIAEDLHLAGREVHLCVGSAPRVARRYRGKDVVEWLEQIGHYNMSIDEHPDGLAVRKKRNHYVTGRDGGRDIDLRVFAQQGMQLYGRLQQIGRDGFEYGDDLEQNLDRADASSERIKQVIDAFITREQIAAPSEPPYKPVWRPERKVLRRSHRELGLGSVIWCGGFALDYSCVDVPVFDPSGYPNHKRGVATDVSGLYFLGLPWLYTWGSGRFCGVGRDAENLAHVIGERVQSGAAA